MSNLPAIVPTPNTPANESAVHKGEIGVIARDQGPLFNVETDGAVPDWNGSTGTDSSAAFLTALDKAALVSGTVVFYGHYYLGTGIDIPQGVSFLGDDVLGSSLNSDYDGHIVRTDYEGAPFNNKGVRIGNFTINGDLTKTSQDGMSFLRFNLPSKAFNILSQGCGRHGVCIYQSVGGHFEDIAAEGNEGRGFHINEGYDFWTDFPGTPNGLPTNAATFININSDLNEGAGLYMDNATGNTFHGGFIQRSFNDFNPSGECAGYNIHFDGTAYGNTFFGMWCEGPCKAHVYSSVSSGNSNVANYFYNFHHQPTSTFPPERGVIVDTGAVAIIGQTNSTSLYKVVARGSNPAAIHSDIATPFRCCTNNSSAWLADTSYTVGTVATNGGNRYVVTTAGTSASSGGPTGTVIDPASRDITDNGITWIYDGFDGLGRVAVLGGTLPSGAQGINGTDYYMIENQIGLEPSTLYASEVLFWNSNHPQPTIKSAAYTPTNVSTDRSYDANSTTTEEIADVLGTLIADLKTARILT